MLAVLTTSLISSIVGISLMKLISGANSGAAALEIKLTHTQLAARLTHYAFSPASLYATYMRANPENAFYNCLTKDPSTGLCIHNHTYGFNLLDYSTAPSQIAGTISKPLYYDIEGRICKAPDRSCVFQAYVSFVAKCLIPQTECDQAEGLEVSLVLEPIPDNSLADLGNRGLASLTLGKRLLKTAFVSTREIMNAKPEDDTPEDPIHSCTWYVSPKTGTEPTIPSPFDGVECASHLNEYFDHCHCPSNKRLQGIDRCSSGMDAMMRCLCC